MIRFAKKQNCPSSETLDAYLADSLNALARNSVGAHLRSCDFCDAELRLLARGAQQAEAAESATEATAPPVPLALRLFAETRLAEASALASCRELRAA